MEKRRLLLAEDLTRQNKWWLSWHDAWHKPASISVWKKRSLDVLQNFCFGVLRIKERVWALLKVIWFKNIFCYADWKSLHILIAITKLSGLNDLNLIYIVCWRHGTINLHPIISLCPRAVLPASQCMHLQTWYVISTFHYALEVEREWKALLL